MSKQRYVLLVFVLFALGVGLTAQAALESGFAQYAIPDNRLMGLMATSSALAVLAGGTSFAVLIRNRPALTFTGEVVTELARVTWPTRDEALRAATTVVLTALVVAAMVAVFDFTWKNLADLVLFTER
ncbi:MAG: preprotein translocase subunit SecE [Myxococcota bacterium]